MQNMQLATVLSTRTRQQSNVCAETCPGSIEEWESVAIDWWCLQANSVNDTATNTQSVGHKAHQKYGQIQLGDGFNDWRGGRRNWSGEYSQVSHSNFSIKTCSSIWILMNFVRFACSARGWGQLCQQCAYHRKATETKRRQNWSRATHWYESEWTAVQKDPRNTIECVKPEHHRDAKRWDHHEIELIKWTISVLRLN